METKGKPLGFIFKVVHASQERTLEVLWYIAVESKRVDCGVCHDKWNKELKLVSIILNRFESDWYEDADEKKDEKTEPKIISLLLKVACKDGKIDLFSNRGIFNIKILYYKLYQPN